MSRVAPQATAFADREWPVMFSAAALVGSADDPDRSHAIYPSETLARLARVTSAWGPDDVFRRNHTVLPAT